MPARRRPAARNDLSLKLGSWFEAHATGWGIVAVPAILLLLLLAQGAALLLR